MRIHLHDDVIVYVWNVIQIIKYFPETFDKRAIHVKLRVSVVCCMYGYM